MTREAAAHVQNPWLDRIVLLLLIVAHFSWEISRLEDRTRTLAEEVALLNLSREEQQRP